MKKNISTMLVAAFFFVLAGAMPPVAGFAQEIVDVATVVEEKPLCLDLQYGLKLRSKDANTKGEVSMFQRFLKDEGFPITDPDGYFGLSTQRALKNFQGRNGIFASGVAWSSTRKVIKQRSCNRQTKPIRAIPVAVKQIEPAGVTASSGPVSILESFVPIASSDPTLGTFYIFADEIAEAAGSPVTLEIAMGNCKNAEQFHQGKKRIRCVWKDKEIYSSPSTVNTISQKSLSAGTASSTVSEPKNEKPKIVIPPPNVSLLAPAGLLPFIEEDSNVVRPFVKLTISSSIITKGDGVTLSWQIQDATKCIVKYGDTKEDIPLTSGVHRSEGSKTYYPKQETYYHVQCVNIPKNDGKGAKGDGLVSVKVLAAQSGSQMTQAVAFGVYHGLYSGGISPASHSEAMAKITIPKTAAGRTLVLTAYEPTNWVLNNSNKVQIKNIIAVGYHDQKVSGDVPKVPIEYNSLKSNNIVHFAYDVKEPEYARLVLWLKTKGVILDSKDFTGAYEAVTFLPAEEQVTYSRPENALSAIYLNNVLKEKMGNSSRMDAFSHCRDYIKDNSANVGVRCEWGGEILLSNEVDGPVSSLLDNEIPKGRVLGASAMCVDLPRSIHRGDESALTKQVQVFLKKKGFLKEDASGFYGDKTVEAVKLYQLSIGLPETGMVYDFTKQAIKDETCGGI